MQQIQAHLDGAERLVQWMYLDSKGYVTVGIGTRLYSVADAQTLPFYHDRDFACSPVALGDIARAYNTVAADSMAQRARSPKRRYTSYESTTNLRIDGGTAARLRNEYIERSYLALKKIYWEFDSFPDSVKLALFDMIYNVGEAGLRDGFPTMNRAIRERRWLDAANESHRQDVDSDRNYWTGRMFGQAALQESKGDVFNKVAKYSRSHRLWR
jgi:GH24 family phage-related lysozyme (muramidase)